LVNISQKITLKRNCFILLLIILTGCSGLSNSWNNFTAYYNTFYNAKNDYKAGLKKVEDQPVQINPDTPVRAHPAPVNVGGENFEEAINNSALLIRRHSNSKWTDDALLLIGKSYYYRQEFFLAIQTFEDLLNFPTPTPLKQQAVIWKGRALLDIASYGEGISFLGTQLSAFEGDWDPEKKAEAQIILAQHFAMLQNWQQSADLLRSAIPIIKKQAFKGRSYYLLGQVLQRLENFEGAYQAYSNVASNFPDYEYIYWAGIKRAEVSRLNGDFDKAISIYLSMLNDDKNFDRNDEIYNQLAQTYVQEGDFRQAEQIYKRILNNTSANRSPDLLSDIYYQLGQLYSSEYNNYQLAAAYFDSSSAQSTQQLQNRKKEDAIKLVSAYEDYIFLKDQIARTDSLLRLGDLNIGERDSVVVRVRRQRRAALQNNRKRIAQTGNTLFNVNRGDTVGTSGPTDAISSFGFLNYRNARRVENAKQQFRAVWGQRPLVDNWRRTNVIRSISSNDRRIVAEEPGTIDEGQNSTSDEDLGINIAEIPISPKAKEAIKQERVNLQYRLGNLFFLTLNQADSAAFYFKEVLEDTVSSEVKPKALYSLYKLYEEEENADSAAFYKQKILTDYTSSVYAKRIRNQPDGKETVSPSDSTVLLQRRVQVLLNEQDSLPPSRRIAEQRRRLALENRNSDIAPDIYFQAIREYIRFAKNSSNDAAAIEDQTANSDTLQQIGSSNVSPDYSGKAWDRVRELLAEFKQLFPKAEQMEAINVWAEEIGNSGSNTVLRCEKLGVKPKVKPDMQTFVSTIDLPDKVKGLNLSGKLNYRLLINRDGTVESYELLSNPTNLGIEDSYETAIKNSLAFEPITQNGKAVRISCEVEFPIKQRRGG